jgi:mRNA interferase RelE/StbE
MTYRLRFTPGAATQIATLEKHYFARIRVFLERLDRENPRPQGMALVGEGSFWRDRVGDYRIIAHTSERKLLVLVVNVGHQRHVYRRPR